MDSSLGRLPDDGDAIEPDDMVRRSFRDRDVRASGATALFNGSVQAIGGGQCSSDYCNSAVPLKQ